MLKRNSINVHSHTRPLVKSREPAGRIGDFGNFLNGFAKSQRLIVLNIDWVQFVLKNSEILHSVRGLYDINTAPHSTLSPQMWCIKSIKGWLTHFQICWQDFVKLTYRTQKIRPDLFSRTNLLWSRAVMALECDERWLLFSFWVNI